MPTNLEHMESDELQKMGTSRNANKRKGDQPEVLAAKEQRLRTSRWTKDHKMRA